MFQELERLDEAVAHYRKAIDIKPDYSEAHYNLANLLKELERLDEAIVHYRKAIAINPRNGLFWAGLAASLEAYSFPSVDDDLWQVLGDLLENPTIDHSYVVRPILSVTRHNPDFARLLKPVNAEERDRADDNAAYAEVANRLSSIPLLLKIMTLSVINDLEVERMLTDLRRSKILGPMHENCAGDEKSLSFYTALALHCFVNEYVFKETAEETIAVAGQR